MRKRSLGRTGIEVSEISLGCWGLSGEGYGDVFPADAKETVAAALDAGCTLIEYAECYGPPEFEFDALLGEALHGRARDSFQLAVRIGVDRASSPARKRFDRKSLTEMLERTLKRLKLEAVDIVLLHNPVGASLERSFEALDTLASLRERGLARAMGASVGSIDAGRAALKQSVDVIELPYNALAPKLMHALTPEMARRGVGILARSPLGYGVFADSWHADRVFAQGDHRVDRWLPEELARRIRQREVLRGFVRAPVTCLREAAIRYVLMNPMISSVVVGSRTPLMATQNALAGEEKPYLNNELFSTLAARMEEEGIES